MIRFRKGKPVGIYYSQHVDGKAWSWNDSTISKLGDRVGETSVSPNVEHVPNPQ